ncbi:M56 family metallopeptidase [Flavonifractor sp. An100]|uniref:M56 family metallopeptidase n=1 Tax=Flavonifractor sp. An100 TaxID=1965538 RepID=UPI000B38230A|nr:M56 family metallopeptidase [Flavonifractor sp. An100]OUQ78187.1 hypothetical protein B5E43_09030 [Flavonifractor sp. An100]
MNAIFMPIDALFQWLLPVLPSLQQLGEWAVSGSVLILIVLGLGAFLKGKLSCRVRYALWGVVLVRLLLPFQLPLSLPMSSAQAVPDAPDAWETTYVPVFPGQTQNIDDTHPYYQDLEPGYEGPGPWSQGYVERSEDGETVTTYLDCFTQAEILQLIWGVGVLAALLLILVPNVRFALRLEKMRKTLEIPDCPLPVYETEGLPSPCLFGLFHPAIYLTAEAAELSEGERRHVLAHELTHYHHKDHIWAALRCLCLALHWYNPLVWLAVLCSKRDGELACDEGTVERLGEAERIPYGRTLVGLVARRSLRPGDLVSCSTAMTGGKTTIQQRIALLVKKPETKRTALFLALSLAALAVVFTFAGGRAAEGWATDYNGFKSEIRQAQSIGYAPPLYSSQGYPDPITDEDLLEEARSLLYDKVHDLLTPVEADWGELVIHASTLTLVTQRGEEHQYFLCPWDGDVYVLAPAQWDAEGYTPVVVYPKEYTVTTALETLARQQRERNSSERTSLTQEEIDWFNEEFFNSGEKGTAIQNLFFASLYDQPQDIDLFQLFYLGGLDGESEALTPQERQAVVETGYSGMEPDCPCTKITRAEMDQTLFQYTGLTLDETNQYGLGSFTYLAEYDAYYHYHGDTNFTSVTVTSGTREGDLVYLTYESSYYFPDAQGRQLVATLRQTGEGYHFVANQVGVEISQGFSAEGMIFESDGNFAETAQTFGKALAQAYLALPENDPGAVTDALADSWTFTRTLPGEEDEFCIRLSLIVDPVEPNTIYWMAGAGLDQNEEGEWVLTREYRLERVEGNTWTCTEVGGNVSLSNDAAADYEKVLSAMAGLQTEDILSITPWDMGALPDGWADNLNREELAQFIREAAGQPRESLEGHNDEEWLDHSLWQVEVLISPGWSISLMAGRAEDQVSISEAITLTNCPGLYDLIRQAAGSGQTITVQNESVLACMDQVLAKELEQVRDPAITPDHPEAYLDAELTQLNPLATLDGGEEGTELHIYLYDFGFVMDDLANAPWAGGPWVDGRLRYHMYGYYKHLITLERDGRVERYVTYSNEYPLDEESYAQAYADGVMEYPTLAEFAARLLEEEG